MIKNKLIRVEEIPKIKGKGMKLTYVYECANAGCGGEVLVDTRKYNYKSKDSDPNYLGCCRSCANSDYVNTNLRKKQNPFRDPKVQANIKEGFLKKYGVDNPFKSDIIKDKIRATHMALYGVDNPNKSVIIREKTKQTCLKKYGSE